MQRWPILVVLSALIIWAIVYRSLELGSFLLPYPRDVLMAMVSLFTKQQVSVDIAYTCYRMLSGYGLASIFGIGLGLVIGHYRIAYRLVIPMVDFFRSTPVTVLYPVFVLAFGVGSAAKIAMIFTACVFVIILNTAYEVRSVSPIRIVNAKLYGATEFELLRHVIIRDATPHILVGMRTSLSLSLIVAILVDMFMGSEYGIGQKVIEAYTSYRIAAVYALIIITGLLGYILNVLFIHFEKTCAHWYWNERNHS